MLAASWIVVPIDLSQGQVYDFGHFANTAIGIIGSVLGAILTPVGLVIAAVIASRNSPPGT